MSREHASGILTRFGERVGIDGLAYDEGGYCCLQFDETTVSLELVEDGSIFLYSTLGSAPEEDREAFFVSLLSANCLCRQTGGGVLGYDEQLNAVVFTMQTDSEHLQDESFEQILENFLNVSATWSQWISEFGHEPATADQESGEANASSAGLRV